jgi:hypothetical protein
VEATVTTTMAVATAMVAGSDNNQLKATAGETTAAATATADATVTTTMTTVN